MTQVLFLLGLILVIFFGSGGLGEVGVPLLGFGFVFFAGWLLALVMIPLEKFSSKLNI